MENSNSVKTYTIDKLNHTVTIFGYVYSEVVFERLCCIDADSALMADRLGITKRAAATLMQLGFIEVFHYTQADNIPNCEDLGDKFTIIAFDSEETGLVEVGAIPGDHYPIFSVPVCDVLRDNAPGCDDAMLALCAIQAALQELRG